jgi:serine kinase of HPr protein (carbohydrate metabolism regulator)
VSGEAANLHASCVLVGPHAVLLRGPSGAGKSRLGDLLVTNARAEGRFAAHVADDRVLVRVVSGRLTAEAPAALVGLWERRGEGIVRVEEERRAVLRLVVDLVPAAEIERMPAESALADVVAGVRLPRVFVAVEDLHQAALRILSRLARG